MFISRGKGTASVDCTPHFNRKYELILFRGRKTDSAPNFWSPGSPVIWRAPPSAAAGDNIIPLRHSKRNPPDMSGGQKTTREGSTAASPRTPELIVTVPMHAAGRKQLSEMLQRWVVLPACDPTRGAPVADLMFVTGKKSESSLKLASWAYRNLGPSARKALRRCFRTISYALSDLPPEKDSYDYGV